MKIFLRNLGEGVTRRELAALVESAARPPWYRFFASDVRLQQCEIVRMTDEMTGESEYHGFLELSGANTHKILRELNQMEVLGRFIEARRWIERTGPRDRRGADIGANLDRRHGHGDRRRSLRIDFSAGAGNALLSSL